MAKRYVAVLRDSKGDTPCHSWLWHDDVDAIYTYICEHQPSGIVYHGYDTLELIDTETGKILYKEFGGCCEIDDMVFDDTSSKFRPRT